MPMTLFMSLGSSARASGKKKLCLREVQFPRSNDRLGLSSDLVPPGPDAFALKEERVLTCPLSSAPAVTGHEKCLRMEVTAQGRANLGSLVPGPFQPQDSHVYKVHL